MRAHSEDMPIPLGHVEPRRHCRELSALTDGDLATPAVVRRAERAQAQADIELVMGVLAGHGIGDLSAAEHILEVLRAKGRLK